MKPEIIELNIDDNISLLMSSPWQPGNGKPPWANPNKRNSNIFEDEVFSESPFNDDVFVK